jgi:ribosomal protein RSM22 (predicted rRNA methylase)
MPASRTPAAGSAAAVSLRRAIDDALTGYDHRLLKATAEALSAAYRSGARPERPLLRDDASVRAYAAHRMPATVAAIGAALHQVTEVVTSPPPRVLVDVGAGTGAAGWAALDVWPTVNEVVLLEPEDAARDLGRRLARDCPLPALQSAEWRPWRMTRDSGVPDVRADVATAAYVYGEIAEADQDRLTTQLCAVAPIVVIVEPGTPHGYRRILRARDQLIGLGMRIAAPCPHDVGCPLAGAGGDWCHFGERLARSSRQRQLKDAELSYEDEKYCFVAATRHPVDVAGAARVLRRPRYGRHVVRLELCRPDGSAAPLSIPQSSDRYRAARQVSWGGLFAAGGPQAQ